VGVGFEIERDVPLAMSTTLELGGPARWFVRAKTIDQLKAAVTWGRENAVETVILAGGSNLVVGDAGWDGLVVQLAVRGKNIGGDGAVFAAAGEPWDPLVEQTIARDLGGLECLSGIPGSVGATPIQNVGAYGQEIAEVLEAVHVLEIGSGTERVLAPAECQLGYRDSRFKREPGRVVVTGVQLRLRPHAHPVLRYAELQRALEGETPTLSRTREVVLELRRRKSMLVEPDDPNRRSVGSFFTNPIVSNEGADALVRRAVAHGLVDRPEDVPRWPASVGGRTKLAAAWLIERAGIPKGYRRGAVGISSRHTLALVHHGCGTTKELLELAAHVRDAVLDAFGVELHLEPTLLGASMP
jgi:UDP-N-acetylmuramate dehydrogenase